MYWLAFPLAMLLLGPVWLGGFGSIRGRDSGPDFTTAEGGTGIPPHFETSEGGTGIPPNFETSEGGTGIPPHRL